MFYRVLAALEDTAEAKTAFEYALRLARHERAQLHAVAVGAMPELGFVVAAKAFTAEVWSAEFTHYKREEDATMKSGKLDEELSRMSDITDAITPKAMLLFNESFAAANEREGSEIARQVVSALLEKRVKVFFVTHLYECAHGLWENKMDSALFLRAERQADGRRTFKLLEGERLQTSYGVDLYDEIFGGA